MPYAFAVGGRSLPVGGAVAAVGGAVAAVGAFLTWESINDVFSGCLQAGCTLTPVGSSPVSGWSSGYAGKIVAVLGLVALALAVVWLMNLKLPIPSLRMHGFVITSTEGLVALAGVLCLLAGLWGILGVSNDISDSKGSMGLGIFVAIAGAATVVVGGLLRVLTQATASDASPAPTA
ncbi:MAG: hypothetical protein ABSG37_06580 [Candidatus Limnocylindrales bacterium]